MTTCSYPAYRTAKSEWLDAVPEHWGEGKLRWLSRRYAGGTPDKAREDYWTDGTIPWLNSGSVNQGTIREPSAFITDDAFANSSARWVPAGALVIALAGQGKTKGMVAQLALPSTCNQSMAAIVPDAELGARYLYWWLSSNYQNLRNMAGGDNRDGLNLELLGNVSCPIPPLEEQTAVAAFLDRETGKIDALVEAQRRLIELLKEKRQAVISHAVTKGLNPSALMKDSGIGWLGRVPEHWSVVPTRSLVARRRQLVGDRHADFQLLSLTLGGIILRDRESGHGKFPAEFDTYQVVGPGDLVFCLFDMDETPRTVGLSEHAGMVTGAYDVFSGKIEDAAEFLFWLYLSRDFNKSLKPFYTGLRKVIRKETFGSIPVALPPISERRAIIEYLQAVTMKLDALSAQAVQAISLLQERRAALISAVVTGKIDVRSLVPEQAETA